MRTTMKAPKKKPPKCGPLARLVWDGGRWVRTLTPAGRRAVDDYLRKYPNPAAVLYRTFPQVARRAFERFPADEVHQAARVGIATAFSLFDPAVGVKPESFVVPHIRVSVDRLMWRRAGEPARFIHPDEFDPDEPGGGGWEAVPAPEPDRTPWTSDDWDRLLAVLTDRERECVILRYADELKLDEIGLRFRLSKERVRQVLAAAVEKLRAEWAGRDPDGDKA